ncbi:MAG TPA: decaprenyl-phosphate phosphoribosyltransferase [Polyangiaceae bacterium]|nr:decaprenyl-phosphate phosphoribosyltransferase [Polyangiaceae bacterium]
MSDPQRFSGSSAEPETKSGNRPATGEPPSDPPSALIELARQGKQQGKGSGLWWRLGGIVRTVRPHQWVKNVFVLAPVVFAKEIFDAQLLENATSAFFVFCLLAGAVYAMNDLADIEADRVHPVKKYRPIPSGRVPPNAARALATVLVVGSLGWAYVLEPTFALVAAIYFAQNVAYSFKLKHVAYLDVGFIAAGFVLRVMGGGYATRTPVSMYLLVCTALLALFLGFGKRRHELSAASGKASLQRAALEQYSKRGLDVALAITGLATIATYVVYTLDPRTEAFFRTRYLWVSSLFVLLGVGRFLQLVKSRPKSESPTQEMLRDGPFVAIVLLWVVLVMIVVYRLKPG